MVANTLQLWYNVGMNGYDFDKTILRGNTVQRFWWYCALRFPYLWLLLPLAIVVCLLFGLHIIGKHTFLLLMETFIALVPNKKKHAVLFWNKNEKHLKQWYLDSKQPSDLVVSASPDFLIGEICSRLQVKFIATKTRSNGLALGKHCYGAEKVAEFRKCYPDAELETYYSDSLSDAPMFKIAKRGYHVRGDKITLVYQNGEKVSAK